MYIMTTGRFCKAPDTIAWRTQLHLTLVQYSGDRWWKPCSSQFCFCSSAHIPCMLVTRRGSYFARSLFLPQSLHCMCMDVPSSKKSRLTSNVHIFQNGCLLVVRPMLFKEQNAFVELPRVDPGVWRFFFPWRRWVIICTRSSWGKKLSYTGVDPGKLNERTQYMRHHPYSQISFSWLGLELGAKFHHNT